ncbi:MAG TPA: type II secretion system protein [Candidatus Dormibacteraeota bacterium]|nr:type II secretion system protein [Candidatus Dormibacteraeota bacterium]
MGWFYDRFVRDRRRAQSGTTLVELLVSVVIIGFALAIVIGTFSTGLLDATLAKRNTAAEAVAQYELDKISASTYAGDAPGYSECFATESSNAPAPAAGYRGACPDSTDTVRADVAWVPGAAANIQVWTVTVVSLATASQVGNPISVLKVDR